MSQTEHALPASYDALLERLHLHPPLPYTRDWSAAADFLEVIADDCLARQPSIIVECSSGFTSLVLARCCQMNRQGHVYSLENGEDYAQATRRCMDAHGLNDRASILHAPLVSTRVHDRQYQWYARDQLPESSIDMLVIDGPPGFIQSLSRYPALPLLHEQLAPGCRIFLDDAAREDEQTIIRLWQQAFPDLQLDYIANERGCAVLTKIK